MLVGTTGYSIGYAIAIDEPDVSVSVCTYHRSEDVRFQGRTRLTAPFFPISSPKSSKEQGAPNGKREPWFDVRIHDNSSMAIALEYGLGLSRSLDVADPWGEMVEP